MTDEKLPMRDFRKPGRRAKPAGDRLPDGKSKATAERKAAFIELFRQSGSIAAACSAMGMNRRRVADWRKQDTAFADAFALVCEDVLGKLEAEAYRRAVEGHDDPIVSAGKILGSRKVYSDTLLKVLLAARDPASYAAPGAQVAIATRGNAYVTFTPEQRRSLMAGLCANMIGQRDDAPAIEGEAERD